MSPSHFTSDQFAGSRFASHGRTEAQVQGRLLRMVQWGPYNLEWVQAHCRLLQAAGTRLPPDRAYLELTELRTSLLLSIEGWDLMQTFMDQSVARGFCAKATVLVISPEIEGYSLFWKRCHALYARSRPVHVVATRVAGEALLVQLLQQDGLDDALHQAGLGAQAQFSSHPS